eukprot:Rmarinus@m.9815
MRCEELMQGVLLILLISFCLIFAGWVNPNLGVNTLPEDLWITGENPLGGDVIYNSETEYCNIERYNANELSKETFANEYYNQRPVIITFPSTWNAAVKEKVRLENLRMNHGSIEVMLASSNTYSYEKLTTDLLTYLDEMMGPQTLNNLGKDTYYLFGDTMTTEWVSLLHDYEVPPYRGRTVSACTLGLGGLGSGVPFHIHGGGYSETLHGRKRWFLLRDRPEFDPDQSQLQWLNGPFYQSQRTWLDQEMLQCTINPGDVLYFPNMWYHATLNLDHYTS